MPPSGPCTVPPRGPEVVPSGSRRPRPAQGPEPPVPGRDPSGSSNPVPCGTGPDRSKGRSCLAGGRGWLRPGLEPGPVRVADAVPCGAGPDQSKAPEPPVPGVVPTGPGSPPRAGPRTRSCAGPVQWPGARSVRVPAWPRPGSPTFRGLRSSSARCMRTPVLRRSWWRCSEGLPFRPVSVRVGPPPLVVGGVVTCRNARAPAARALRVRRGPSGSGPPVPRPVSARGGAPGASRRRRRLSGPGPVQRDGTGWRSQVKSPRPPGAVSSAASPAAASART